MNPILFLMVLAMLWPASGSAALAAEQGTWSLVMARAVFQKDPRPLDCPPEDICLDAEFRGTFDRAKVIAGPDLPPKFEAKVVQHTRWINKPRVLLLLQRLPDGRRSVFAQVTADETGRYCMKRNWFDGRLKPPTNTSFADRPDEVCVRP